MGKGRLYGSRKGFFPHPQNAEVCSAICGDRIPQFAEILFTKTGDSYLFQFVRVAIEFVPELHIMLMGVQKSEIVRTGTSLPISIF